MRNLSYLATLLHVHNLCEPSGQALLGEHIEREDAKVGQKRDESDKRAEKRCLDTYLSTCWYELEDAGC